jgi:hypothetical protein
VFPLPRTGFYLLLQISVPIALNRILPPPADQCSHCPEQDSTSSCRSVFPLPQTGFYPLLQISVLIALNRIVASSTDQCSHCPVQDSTSSCLLQCSHWPEQDSTSSCRSVFPLPQTGFYLLLQISVLIALNRILASPTDQCSHCPVQDSNSSCFLQCSHCPEQDSTSSCRSVFSLP